jgi:hypothetical protein
MVYYWIWGEEKVAELLECTNWLFLAGVLGRVFDVAATDIFSDIFWDCLTWDFVFLEFLHCTHEVNDVHIKLLIQKLKDLLASVFIAQIDHF